MFKFSPQIWLFKFDLKNFVNTYEFLLQMIRSPEMSITRIWVPLTTIASFQKVDKWSGSYLPKGQPLGSHMVGYKYTHHPDTPNMIG
jgi:hypothetical protein